MRPLISADNHVFEPVTLWRSERFLAAGIVTGLLFYKPQLGAILALALIITAGWKPLCGLACPRPHCAADWSAVVRNWMHA